MGQVYESKFLLLSFHMQTAGIIGIKEIKTKKKNVQVLVLMHVNPVTSLLIIYHNTTFTGNISLPHIWNSQTSGYQNEYRNICML